MRNLSVFTVLLLHIFNVYGQRIVSSTISPFGLNVYSENLTLMMTAGQASLIERETDGSGLGVRQGFIQPLFIRKKGKEERSFSVFPNPASHNIFVNAINDLETPFSLRIMSSWGTSVYDNPSQQVKSTEMDVSFLMDGFYALHITQGNKTEVHKFILVKR